MKSVQIDQGKTYYKMVSDEGTAVLDIVFDFDNKCWLVSSKEPTTAFSRKLNMGVHQKEEVVTLAIKMLRCAAESHKAEKRMRYVILICIILFAAGYVVTVVYPPLDEMVRRFLPIPIFMGLVYNLYIIVASRRRGIWV